MKIEKKYMTCVYWINALHRIRKLDGQFSAVRGTGLTPTLKDALKFGRGVARPSIRLSEI